MISSGRSVSLKNRHADLDREVRAEQRRPAPDTHKVTCLKREKLRIKDALLALRASQRYVPSLISVRP